MNRLSLAISFAPLLLLAVGCGVEQRTYEVTVRNDSPRPIMVWLYKDGGPYEDGWKSPEDLAVESPKAGTPLGGSIVPPRSIASTGPRKGQFGGQSAAVLRVYLGQHHFNELLAMSRENAERQDVKLEPGRNTFAVSERVGKVAVDRIADLPPVPPAEKPAK